ncbi:DUF397 domain-containing protein [Streptomyces halobius]|uniref:DUF397 domain-containing protein n=1 Tax=Streptomyces halobius TaxID=2879846 RepID=A0ABY4MC09_9ACTN|nr:DUF397 domain-containing protein [Streptomyces halobius]UQA94968.1 DUF397 domain-containing protein [Streptomyces halobius]
MSEVLAWQKSSFSEGEEGPDCVELATLDRTLLLRESEIPARALSATPTGLAALIRHIRGEAE